MLMIIHYKNPSIYEPRCNNYKTPKCTVFAVNSIDGVCTIFQV